MTVKNSKIIFILFIFYSSCSSVIITAHNKDNLEIPFAKIENDKLIIIQDTTLLKQKLLENITSEKPIHFNKVEILKRKTIGDVQEEYYFVLVTNNQYNIKIARWLNLVGNELYFNDKTNQVDSFEQIYLTCVGNNDCYPEVFIIDNKRSWGCTKNPKCITDPEKVDKSDCDSYTTVFISDLKD